MTGREMIDGVRELLHDNGRGYATAQRFWTTEEILRRLNEAKVRIGRILATQDKPAIASSSRLVKSASKSDGQPVPPDFFKLIGGLDANDRWVPPAPLSLAEPLVAQGHDYVYVKAGNVYGPQAKILYWAIADEPIVNSPVALTEFSNSLYYTIQLLAARECLPQEKSDAIDRWKLFSDMLPQELQTFS